MKIDNGIKASVIITNYQGKKFLKKCLTHLSNQSYKQYEIIFVDSGSTDGSPVYVEENFPNIKLIRCGRIGIGEAVNIGIRNATGEVIIFDVNTDEYVEYTWLEEIMKQLARYNYKIITGPVRIIYETDMIDEAGVNLNFFGKAKKVGHLQKIQSFPLNDEQVDFIGSPAFHRNILTFTGGIDEEYFIYAEDLDFCYRARLAGYETRCAPQARSHHHVRGTLGASTQRLEYYLRRANIRFQLIYTDSINLLPALIYFGLFLPLSALCVCLIKINLSRLYFDKFIGRIKAINWNIQNLSKSFQKRKDVRRCIANNETMRLKL